MPAGGPDAATAEEELHAARCEVLDQRGDAEHGKFGWVIDPDGNEIELWEPPPGQ